MWLCCLKEVVRYMKHAHNTFFQSKKKPTAINNKKSLPQETTAATAQKTEL
jgi:hypothetical protein